MFNYSVHQLTAKEASDVATYMSIRNVWENNASHYTCGGGGVNHQGISSGRSSHTFNMQSGVSMRLQNVLKHWGCWSVGDESITANLPNVRHLGATEHPFLSNARGPELAVDGNKNGFGEMYLSQTVSI